MISLCLVCYRIFVYCEVLGINVILNYVIVVVKLKIFCYKMYGYWIVKINWVFGVRVVFFV